MSTIGQTLAPSHHRRPEWPGRPVIAFSRDLRAGDVIARHHHDHAQFLYAVAGLMRVATEVGTWVVPPQRAVWIPPGIGHEVAAVGACAMRTVYVHVNAAAAGPDACCVVTVSPLLRELALSTIDLPPSHAADGPEARLIRVLLDRIAAAPVAELHLPQPVDRRTRYVTERLIADPADGRTLADWAREAGASVRTLARLFRAETGLSFRAWRQQARLHAALARLAAGESVTATAFAVGYDSPSAFIAMFREATGSTPGRFLTGAGER